MINLLQGTVVCWQGIGRAKSELMSFYQKLLEIGFDVDTMPHDYDTEKMPNNPNSCIYKWVAGRSTSNVEWWIGISLGASVAYIVASVIDIKLRPKRITLINPFSDRIKLSVENNFSLRNQWPIIPIKHRLFVNTVDIVLSLRDAKIANSHGLSLLSKIESSKLNIITIDSDHTLSKNTDQIKLADILLAIGR